MSVRERKVALENWLTTCKQLKPYMRYSTADKLFANEPLWKECDNVSDREDLFKAAMEQVMKQEELKDVAESKRNTQMLRNVLDNMPDIIFKTTWVEAKELLSKNPVFTKNDSLNKMSKLDALLAFEEHIISLEDEEKDRLKKVYNDKKRNDRKNREEYRDFLKSLHKAGTLSSISYWSELFPVISKQECFDNLLKSNDSESPLDMFKVYVMELKGLYDQDKAILKRILERAGASIETTTEPEVFEQLVREDDEGLKIDKNHIKFFYTSQKLRAEKRKRHAQKSEEKRIKKLESAFKKMLSALEVSAETTYDSIEVKILEEEAYKTCESDDQRRAFFDAYIKGLMEACGHNHNSSNKHRGGSKKKDKKLRKYEALTDSDEEAAKVAAIKESEAKKAIKRPLEEISAISSDEEEPIPTKKTKSLAEEELSEGEIRDD